MSGAFSGFSSRQIEQSYNILVEQLLRLLSRRLLRFFQESSSLVASSESAFTESLTRLLNEMTFFERSKHFPPKFTDNIRELSTAFKIPLPPNAISTLQQQQITKKLVRSEISFVRAPAIDDLAEPTTSGNGTRQKTTVQLQFHESLPSSLQQPNINNNNENISPNYGEPMHSQSLQHQQQYPRSGDTLANVISGVHQTQSGTPQSQQFQKNQQRLQVNSKLPRFVKSHAPNHQSDPLHSYTNNNNTLAQTMNYINQVKSSSKVLTTNTTQDMTITEEDDELNDTSQMRSNRRIESLNHQHHSHSQHHHNHSISDRTQHALNGGYNRAVSEDDKFDAAFKHQMLNNNNQLQGTNSSSTKFPQLQKKPKRSTTTKRHRKRSLILNQIYSAGFNEQNLIQLPSGQFSLPHHNSQHLQIRSKSNARSEEHNSNSHSNKNQPLYSLQSQTSPVHNEQLVTSSSHIANQLITNNNNNNNFFARENNSNTRVPTQQTTVNESNNQSIAPTNNNSILANGSMLLNNYDISKQEQSKVIAKPRSSASRIGSESQKIEKQHSDYQTMYSVRILPFEGPAAAASGSSPSQQKQRSESNASRLLEDSLGEIQQIQQHLNNPPQNSTPSRSHSSHNQFNRSILQSNSGSPSGQKLMQPPLITQSSSKAAHHHHLNNIEDTPSSKNIQQIINQRASEFQKNSQWLLQSIKAEAQNNPNGQSLQAAISPFLSIGGMQLTQTKQQRSQMEQSLQQQSAASFELQKKCLSKVSSASMKENQAPMFVNSNNQVTFSSTAESPSNVLQPKNLNSLLMAAATITTTGGNSKKQTGSTVHNYNNNNTGIHGKSKQSGTESLHQLDTPKFSEMYGGSASNVNHHHINAKKPTGSSAFYRRAPKTGGNQQQSSNNSAHNSAVKKHSQYSEQQNDSIDSSIHHTDASTNLQNSIEFQGTN